MQTSAAMSTTLTHSWFMTMRHLRNLARQPRWPARPSSAAAPTGAWS
jgi:hypothetical protein